MRQGDGHARAAPAPLAEFVRLEWVISDVMEREVADDPLFRLKVIGQMPGPEALRASVPALRRDVRIEAFGYDVNALLAARRASRLPPVLPSSRSRAAFVNVPHTGEVRTLVLGDDVAALLEHCDGRTTMVEIATNFASAPGNEKHSGSWALESLENLFERGVIELR